MSSKRYTPHVRPDLSPARLERQWSAISEDPRLHGRSGAGLKLALGALLTVACAAVAWVWVVPHPKPVSGPMEGLTLEAPARTEWALPDGTSLALAQSGHVKVTTWNDKRARLELDRGRAELHVSKLAGRSFTVSAAGVDVTVKGTRFSVELKDSPRAVAVKVTEGRVEVTRGDALHVLGPGDAWEEPIVEAAAADDAALDEGEDDEVDEVVPEAVASDAGAHHRPKRAGGKDARARKLAHLIHQRKLKEAYQLLGPAGFSAEVQRAEPQRLFELAEVARFNDHPNEEADALDALRRRFPKDGLAGLAAFELGRLRMDRLSDAKGAVEALRSAITLAPSAPFREDAEARLVQALEATGDLKACAAARDAYLKDHAAGVHVDVVRKRCVH